MQQNIDWYTRAAVNDIAIFGEVTVVSHCQISAFLNTDRGCSPSKRHFVLIAMSPCAKRWARRYARSA